ncbi:hypothetical protein N8T08_005612 [Aspergillus melleus]|uniref:Uncharacterized protein n=1 Tax=Aspergillus melleus TaxID=138277 RepID=A0ACC3B259_9EURO|nr:hypothetical protein N8T08_005612 [Aspergillus melleus]
MAAKKEYLNAKDFEAGLAELDAEMGRSEWLVAFAPIRMITAGGFLAVSYFKCRDSTGDLDYLIEPEFMGDRDIQGALEAAISNVSFRLHYNEDWVNQAMAIFVTKKARRTLFERAERQGITLFKGKNMEVLAAPIEWALERKLRRIHATDRDRKAELDMVDAVTFLKHMRERNGGPLDLELIRTMNMNQFDVIPDHQTLLQVADAYRRRYKEEVFK